jgi:PAS domain S-box-containing protein
MSVGQVPMNRLRSVFDGMFDGVWLVAADGRTTYANDAMATLLGSTRQQMAGRPVTDFLDGPLQADFSDFLDRQRIHAGERVQVRFRREDGVGVDGLVAGSPITTVDGTYVGTILNFSDVTGRNAIEAQVIQNQRLEAIGQFASGIAHDFNNLLTAIHGYAELAAGSLADGDPVRSDVEQVLASAERASAITRKLLAFARRQILVAADVDPAQIVAGLIPILGPLLGDNVELVLEIAPNHGWVRVDPTQLEQVLVNLAVNARDAMPDGGTTTISISNIGAEDPDRPDYQLIPGPFVRISVADTGTGMDPATLARAFDPFFTTKAPGQGTGLGLSAVSGIVAQSGGMVHVVTAPGDGSTFHVDLPRVAAAEPTRNPVDSKTLSQGRGVVLLVEDDAAVRQFVRRILASSGYTVMVAANAALALRAVERWGDMIDVLVSDIVMLGMNGLDLAARIGERHPGIGVVYMSGNSDAAIGNNGAFGPGVFVSKPFTAETLAGAVGRVLHARDGEFDDVPRAVAAGMSPKGATLRGARPPSLRVVPKPDGPGLPIR